MAAAAPERQKIDIEKSVDDCELLLSTTTKQEIGKGAYSNVYRVESKEGNKYALKVMSLKTVGHRIAASNEKGFYEYIKTYDPDMIPLTYRFTECVTSDNNKESKDKNKETSASSLLALDKEKSTSSLLALDKEKSPSSLLAQPKETRFLQLQELFDGNVLSLFQFHEDHQLPNLRSQLLEPMIGIAIRLGKRRIIHADLKPDNFLYRVLDSKQSLSTKTTKTYKVVVTDFGRCSFATANKQLNNGWTRNAWNCLTLRYDMKEESGTDAEADIDVKLELFAIFVNLQALILSLLTWNMVVWLDDTRKNAPETTWIYRFSFPLNEQGKVLGERFWNSLLPECTLLRKSLEEQVQQIDQLWDTRNKKGAIVFRRQYFFNGLLNDERYVKFLSRPEWN